MTPPRSSGLSTNLFHVCAPARSLSVGFTSCRRNPRGRGPSRCRGPGPEIVKLEVASDPALDDATDGLLAALRRCGLPSLYPDDRAKPTITKLQRVTRRESVEPDVSVLPLELFIADVVIVSRITGLARYEILDTASIPPSR